MRYELGLDVLFILLRGAGVSVGAEEVRRLGQIFSLEPDLDQDGLRCVIEAVLVKTDEELVVVRRVFQQWLGTMGERLDAAESAYAAKGIRRLVNTSAAVAQSLSEAKPAPPPRPGMPQASAPAPASAPAAVPAPQPAYDAAAISTFQAPDMAVERTRKNLAGGELEDDAARADSSSEDVPIGPPVHVRPAFMSQGRYKRALGWQLGFAAAALMIGIAGYALLYPGDSPTHGKLAGTSIKDAGPGSPSATEIEKTYSAQRARKFDQPIFVVREWQQPVPSWPGILLAVGALLAGGYVWQRMGRGRWLPQPLPERQPRPVLIDKPTPVRRDALLLEPSDEEDLVWGVGRFTADEPGPELDVERTVERTAASFGRPILQFHAARYQREAWLLVDEAMDSPVALRLADELGMMLEKSGLPVTRASFWGIPSTIRTERDETLNLDELDARREGLAVAILTDGRLMAIAHRARDRRGPLRDLVRSLSFWPRVTFIDFGRDGGPLRGIVEPHGLRVVQPSDATAAISDVAESPGPVEQGMLTGDGRVWAAACALSQRPVDERTALALRQNLGLQVSPWVIEALRARAVRNAGGIVWSHADRVELLGWLLDAEKLPERGKLPVNCLLARIIHAWELILDERERLLRAAVAHWQGSREQAELALERGFLRLWEQPERATAELYRLYAGRYRRTIQNSLQRMGPRECAGKDGIIVLPWAMASVRPDTQVMLTDMGLGTVAAMSGRASLPRPGRLWLAVGMALGLISGVLAMVAEARYWIERPEPVWNTDQAELQSRKAHTKLVAPIFQWFEPWRAEVRMPWAPEQAFSAEVKAGDTVTLGWIQRDEPCRVEIEGGTFHRCMPGNAGTELQPNRRSYAVIVNPYPERDWAQRFTEELLDSGSVDGVYLLDSESGLRGVPYEYLLRPQPEGSMDQLLVVAPEVPPEVQSHIDDGRRIVVVSSDAMGYLLGVTDQYEGELSLSEVMARRERPLYPLYGSLEQLMVRGRGKCGELEQRCCTGQLEQEPCAAGALCMDSTCKGIMGATVEFLRVVDKRSIDRTKSNRFLQPELACWLEGGPMVVETLDEPRLRMKAAPMSIAYQPEREIRVECRVQEGPVEPVVLGEDFNTHAWSMAENRGHTLAITLRNGDEVSVDYKLSIDVVRTPVEQQIQQKSQRSSQ